MQGSQNHQQNNANCYKAVRTTAVRLRRRDTGNRTGGKSRHNRPGCQRGRHSVLNKRCWESWRPRCKGVGLALTAPHMQRLTPSDSRPRTELKPQNSEREQSLGDPDGIGQRSSVTTQEAKATWGWTGKLHHQNKAFGPPGTPPASENSKEWAKT